MQNKDSDIFEFNNEYDDKGMKHLLTDSEKNPFMNNNYLLNEHGVRLNDYDSNILSNGAYKNMSDDVFKLEYKISKAEEEINTIESQINTANEMCDYDRVAELQVELSKKKDIYKSLLEIYNQTALSAKITDSFSNITEVFFGGKLRSAISEIKRVRNLILSKMPVKISSISKVKKSLQLLENINKNVNSLVTTTIPYGEGRDKYNQLSKYIIKANSIQSEISDFLKKNK